MTDETQDVGLTRAHERYAEAVRQCAFGRYSEALRLWEEAWELYAELGCREEAADCLYWGAFCLESLGRSQDALARYDKARVVFVTIGPSENVAPCPFNGARCLRQSGRHQEAIDRFDEARECYAAQGADKDEADSAYSGVMCPISLDRHEEVAIRSDEAQRLADLAHSEGDQSLRLLSVRHPNRVRAAPECAFGRVWRRAIVCRSCPSFHQALTRRIARMG